MLVLLVDIFVFSCAIYAKRVLAGQLPPGTIKTYSNTHWEYVIIISSSIITSISIFFLTLIITTWPIGVKEIIETDQANDESTQATNSDRQVNVHILFIESFSNGIEKHSDYDIDRGHACSYRSRN